MRCAGRGRKTRYKCVEDDMKDKVLGLHPEWVVFRDNGICGGASFRRIV